MKDLPDKCHIKVKKTGQIKHADTKDKTHSTILKRYPKCDVSWIYVGRENSFQLFAYKGSNGDFPDFVLRDVLQTRKI